MVLNDRVSDIYQNFSICEDNCDYNKMNLTKNLVSCKCSIKTSVKSEFNHPKLDKIIRDSFEDSNLAVIKCFSLVFSFKNKLNNIGFLAFTSLSLLHLPFFVHYFIYSLSSISSFIFKEMVKFNYFNKNTPKIPPKKININKKNKGLKSASKITKQIKDSRESFINLKKTLKNKMNEMN